MTLPQVPAAPEAQPQDRLPWIRQHALLAVILAGVLGLALAGCASTHAKATTPRSATPSASATATGYTDGGGYACDQTEADDFGNCPANPAYGSASATPSGPATLNVGDTETLGDNNDTTIGTVTVESVHVTTQPADPEFGSPPANGYYVIVPVKPPQTPPTLTGSTSTSSTSTTSPEASTTTPATATPTTR
jgi:hypothetical protein